MKVSKIRDGLWRFEVPHSDWSTLASVYAEYDEAVVLIDPLVPAAAAAKERFWQALDRDVLRLARPVLVLVGSVDHGRSADAVAARYLAAGHELSVVGDAAIRDDVSCTLHATFDEFVLPAGLHAVPIPGMSPGETAFVLDPWRVAVFADAVIGAGEGRLRVAPPSFGVKTPAGRALYVRAFRPSIQRIASARPEIVLPSHGAPVLADGASALEEALALPHGGSNVPNLDAFARMLCSLGISSYERVYGHQRSVTRPQYRYQRAHRFREDDAHGAHPLLYAAHPGHPRRQG